MDLVFQVIGGLFYLLNKVFFSLSERARRRADSAQARSWRIAAWVVYLVGLPPWVILFIQRHNWIAASVEAAGLPAMVLGLVMAARGQDYQPPRWLDRLALAGILVGFAYSLYDFGGLTALTQWLEIGLVVGFLVGTYQLAMDRVSGYLWYVLMHLCCAFLMQLQGLHWLFAQQAISLLFIADAYRVRQNASHQAPSPS
jgi:hypothetical protein